MKNLSRRNFVKKTTLVAAGAFAVPQFDIARSAESPNNKLNVAIVGVGGRGSAGLKGCETGI